MRCHYHPNREATGQCADCKIFLCPECIAESRKTIKNTVLCRACIINEVKRQRQKARTDIIFFKVFAVLGGISSILAIIYGVYSGAAAEMPLITTIGGAIVGLLVCPYFFGASMIGLKKTVGWCWRSTIKIIPLTILAAIILLILSLIILAAGSIIGLFITPVILYKARKLLRETEWVETYQEPPCNYTPSANEPLMDTKANFCTNCGSAVANENAFCTHCGKKI